MNLNQITIPSADINKSTFFYEKLGLKLIVDARPKYVRFECPDGDSTFSIHTIDNFTIKNGITIYFEEASLDKYVLELQKKGIAFSQLPEEKSWLWREAWLFDPDGHKIILYYAGGNRKNPPWRISS